MALEGVELMFERIRQEREAFLHKLRGALFAEGQDVQTDSMENTPVRDGFLRGSHVTTVAPFEGIEDAAVEITVGGPAAPYAVYVHEDLEAHHTVGEAKFLENAINRARSGFAKRVAERMKS
jgi:hypothetical protein